jgi:hypothetical protein
MKTYYVSILIVCFIGTAIAGLEDGLIASYSFENNANDSSGNQLHGVVSGAIPTQDRFGNEDSAYGFDGIDDYIEVANTNNLLSLNGHWTISVWVKPNSNCTDFRNGPIIYKVAENNTDNDNYTVAWGSSQYSSTPNKFLAGLEQASNDVDHQVISSNYSSSNWYHIVGIYDGGNISIFVDGFIENSLLIGSVEPYTGSAPLRIGNLQNSSGHGAGTLYTGAFDGVIDDVAIYNRALDATEVLELYLIPEPCTLLLLAVGGMLIRRK